MTDIQAWLDEVSARLDAVRREPAQEERDYDHESRAWSDLYQHAPSDLTIATTALQAVLDLHKPVEVEPSATICAACSNRLPNGRFMPIVEWPCPPIEALQAAIEGRGA